MADADSQAESAHDSLIHDWNREEPDQPEARRITLDDETLRDGLQSPSIFDPPIEQKIEILHLMADLAIDTVDLGLPGAGPRAVEDVTALAREISNGKLKVGANCAARTHLNDIRPIHDVVQKTGVPITAACFIGSSQIRQYTENWDLERMLRSTEEAVKFCADHDLECMYVTEDTTRAHPETLTQLYSTAIRNGAKRLVVCDTVGHATPQGARALVRWIRRLLVELEATEVKVDWHGHNDRGLGLINAIAAAEAGADQLHGCALGIGERCGNTSMDQLLVNLKLMGWIEPDRSLARLPAYVQAVAEATRVPVPSNYPITGKDAFETATGVHAAAVIKAFRKGDTWLANRVYSGVPADEFGLEQVISIGPMSGRSNVTFFLEKRGIEASEELVDRIFEAAKRSPRLLTEQEVLAIAGERAVIDEWSMDGVH